MKNVPELLKFFRDPHAKKIQQHKERYQELAELSNVALDIQDEAAYKSLQAEMREVFMDYLTAVVLDSLYKLLPHIVLICLISLKFKTVTIPIVKFEVSTIFAYLFMYLFVQWVLKPIIRVVKAKLRKVKHDSYSMNN